MRPPSRARIKQERQLPHTYDPNQPRVPAGHQKGGRWTSGDFGHDDPIVQLARGPFPRAGRAFPFPPTVAEPPPTRPTEPVPLRPLPSPVAPGEPTLPKPIIPSVPIPQPPEARPEQPTPEASQNTSIWNNILDAFSRLSLFNNDDRRTVLVLKVLKAREYRRSPALEFEALKDLNWKDVEEICGRQFRRLQRLVNAVYNTIKANHPNLSPQQLGSAVHKEVKDRINRMKDDNFRAETPFVLMRNGSSAGDENTSPKYQEVEKSRAKGSRRFDARLKKPDERTVCVADLKTGDDGLDESYIDEIRKRIGNNDDYKDIDRLIISEVRPIPMRVRRLGPTLKHP